MKRGYSATTSGHQPDRPYAASHHASGNATTTGDENMAPNHQAKAKAYASVHTLNKPVPMSLSSNQDVPPMPMDKESIARNTRAAIRRHALGDVSNVSLLNQVRKA